jgi:hypothetical protein
MFDFILGLAIGLAFGAAIADSLWRRATFKPRDDRGRFEKKT